MSTEKEMKNKENMVAVEALAVCSFGYSVTFVPVVWFERRCPAFRLLSSQMILLVLLVRLAVTQTSSAS